MIESIMNGLLCLKWNNHASAFMKKITLLQEKELYSDATIVCHGKYYPVHRLILSTCSEYFEEIFEKMECKHPFIIVKDIKSSELEALLCYMYRGEVNVLHDALPGLIKAAESLQVKGLAVPDEVIDCAKDSCLLQDIKDEPFTPTSLCEDEAARSSPLLNNFHSDASRDSETRSNSYKRTPKMSKTSSRSLFLPDHEDLTKDKIPFIKSEFDNDVPVIRSEDIRLPVPEGSLADGGESILSKFTADPMVFQSLQNQPQCSSWENVISNFNSLNNDFSNLEGIREKIVRMCLLNPTMSSASPDHDDRRRKSIDFLLLKCSKCSFRTERKTVLRKHVQSFHRSTTARRVVAGATDSTGTTRLKCKHCDFEASQRHMMVVHNRRHTGEKPFKCLVCGYRCAKKWNLIIHMRIHTGEKPHICPYCPFASAYSNILNKHVVLKHKNENLL